MVQLLPRSSTDKKILQTDGWMDQQADFCTTPKPWGFFWYDKANNKVNLGCNNKVHAKNINNPHKLSEPTAYILSFSPFSTDKF